MKKIWIVLLLALGGPLLSARGIDMPVPEGVATVHLFDQTEHNRPQWVELGLEDLLASGEESSVTLPPVQCRLGGRTNSGGFAPRGPINDPAGHLTEPFRSLISHSSTAIGVRTHRPADYYVYFILVLRL